MSDAHRLRALKAFLFVFGVISLLLFGTLFSLTLIDAPVMQEGGALRFMRWEPLAKHIELMLEAVYLVWTVFLFRAARDPLKFVSFIDFTIWANLAHGGLMIVQSHVMTGFHYKLFTDVAYCLGLSLGLLALRPRGVREARPAETV